MGFCYNDEVIDLSPEDISLTVITHGHPDHFSNSNLFKEVHNFGGFRILGSVFIANPLHESERYFLCTKHVYLMRTPGHTPQDISVVAENVPKKGSVAITGRLANLISTIISADHSRQSLRSYSL